MMRRMAIVRWGWVSGGTALLLLAAVAGAQPLRSHGLPACRAELATCREDLQACETGLGGTEVQLLATGQTSCWNTLGNPIACAGTGQDGEFQAGAALDYTDEGDGTIVDDTTGLMWEKLCDQDPAGETCPAEHDVDSTYVWAEAFAKIAMLNTAPCFAGYCDWRLPNVRELASLIDYQVGKEPVVSAAFDTGCGAPCSVIGCSCTGTAYPYWSSTTLVRDPEIAWDVDFFVGEVAYEGKGTFELGVRAVRGGL